MYGMYRLAIQCVVYINSGTGVASTGFFFATGYAAYTKVIKAGHREAVDQLNAVSLTIGIVRGLM
jgi:hypothetical protein